MSIPVANLEFLWREVVNPRLGHAYVWGGSFSPDVNDGTDCSGAVSAELCALVYGPDHMVWERQFWTGTFTGAQPGDHGPFDGVDCTKDLVCIRHPDQAPYGAAMIIAIRQEPDPTDAHMICSVPTRVGGPWTVIEMGGPPDNYHLGITAIDDDEFNQWFYLPGPIGDVSPPPLSPADQGALIIITKGQAMGITPRGIQIALATALVESGMKMYANSNVPESLNYPHDAVGSDHDSCGPFQQRTSTGWGNVAAEMDWGLSAAMFYTALQKFDYDNPDHSPGYFAQLVQVSAYPDRYDQRFDEAVALYNRLANLPPQEDELTPEQDRMIREIHACLFNQIESQSSYRALGEGTIWQLHQLIRNDDSMIHQSYVEAQARDGDPESLALLAAISAADPTKYPNRQEDAARAARFLASLANQPAPTPTPNPTPTPDPVPTPTPTPAPQPGASLADILNVIAQAELQADQLRRQLKAQLGGL